MFHSGPDNIKATVLLLSGWKQDVETEAAACQQRAFQTDDSIFLSGYHDRHV